ncbi:MAG: flagellar basal body P-ring formation chaperone FlgA [Sedimentisphaerales bacterium]
MKNKISKIKIKEEKKIKLFFFYNFAFCILIFTFSSAFQQQASGNDSRLTINLPAEATIEDENVTLGRIAEIKGDETLAAQAGKIGLGRITLPGQTLTIDRTMILSRLMCSTDEIARCKPEFSGAEKVRVSRTARTIKGESFVESALSFLKKSVKDDSIAKWEPGRAPADLILAGETKDIELVPRLVSRNAGGQANLEISVIADGDAAASRQISFRPKFNIRQAVTTTDVKKGTSFTANNIKIEKVLSDEAQPADWTEPTGLLATRDLPAGTVLSPGMAKSPQPKVVIERNQTVVIRIDSAGLIVTAMGKAIQPGGAGDCIKVRNVDSQRVITTKVNEDGTVEPVL